MLLHLHCSRLYSWIRAKMRTWGLTVYLHVCAALMLQEDEDATLFPPSPSGQAAFNLTLAHGTKNSFSTYKANNGGCD